MIASPMLRSIWNYRGFVFGSVRREFNARYSQAVLGAAWSILSPLAMILVYTVIFAQVMSAKLPGVDSTFGYSIYLCAGILTWGLFAEITSRSQNMFLEHANLIKKISFPRICLPLIVVLSSLVNFSIVFGLFTAFMLATDTLPGMVYFAIFPVLAVQVLFSIGLGMIVGILNVFFRDVGQFFTIAVQFWFWLTPVVYPASIVPAAVRDALMYNPLAPIIGAYQTILVHGSAPAWDTLVYPAVLAVLMCVFGMRLFRKRSGEMVDEL